MRHREEITVLDMEDKKDYEKTIKGFCTTLNKCLKFPQNTAFFIEMKTNSRGKLIPIEINPFRYAGEAETQCLLQVRSINTLGILVYTLTFFSINQRRDKFF